MWRPPALEASEDDDNIIFNIGSGRETTLHELCSTIVRLTESSSAIKYSSDPKGRFSLDIAKAMRVLQYRPTTLEEGLIKSIQYIRNSLK
jgi:nucleoside-diphosphate-sugar epimerase